MIQINIKLIGLKNLKKYTKKSRYKAGFFLPTTHCSKITSDNLNKVVPALIWTVACQEGLR